MKTKANNPENRKRRKKTMLKRTAVIFISFVLVSISTNAQDNYNLFSNKGYEIIAMLNSNDSFTTNVSLNDISILSIYPEPVIEESLELELWMTSTEFFYSNSYSIKTELENKLELEDWMLDELNFAVPLNIEKEEALKLENWMLDEKIWI